MAAQDSTQKPQRWYLRKKMFNPRDCIATDGRPKPSTLPSVQPRNRCHSCCHCHTPAFCQRPVAVLLVHENDVLQHCLQSSSSGKGWKAVKGEKPSKVTGRREEAGKGRCTLSIVTSSASIHTSPTQPVRTHPRTRPTTVTRPHSPKHAPQL